MDVVVRGQQVTIDDQLEQYAQQRMERLERHLPLAREAVVEVRREKTRSSQDRFVVQVTVNSNGTFLRAEERAAEPRVAVDAAIDVLDRQVQRHKSKVYRSGRDARQARHAEATVVEPAPEPVDVDEDGEELFDGKVVRVKRFDVKPMAVEEAVEQMELLGHNFFLFYDETDRRYAVLYRRRDGDYGLILPETP